jgi:hypothetical protein
MSNFAREISFLAAILSMSSNMHGNFAADAGSEHEMQEKDQVAHYD